jgi:phosphate transport system permease protein
LRRIIVPWAFPNIVTGLLLGCAEAAGAVAPLMFIAANSVDGLPGPLDQVTSLAFAIFAGTYSPNRPFKDFMGGNQATGSPGLQYASAVLLLLITLGLTLAGLRLKRRYATRYGGA